MRSIYILIPILAAILCACNEDPFTFQLGENLVVTTTKLTLVDTVSVSLSTYKKDSIDTSDKGRLLAGVIHDDVFGDITASSYFQFGLSTGDYGNEIVVNDEDVLDSITLVLKYDQYYVGDTLMEQAYHVFQLTEELEEDEEEGGIYNTSSFSHASVPVGTVRFDPRPGKYRDEELEILLDKELGEEMLTYLQDNNSLDEEDFLESYQGFVLSPVEGESHSVLGFSATDTSLFLRIYAHEPGPINTEKEYNLAMTNSNLQYNQIKLDQDLVQAFDSVTEKIGVSSVYTEDMAYIYGGLGLYARVSFPYLDKITGAAELRNSIIVNATLYMDPEEFNFERSDIVDELRIYETEKNGDLGGILVNDLATDLTTDSYMDEIFPDNSFFTFDLTNYIKGEVGDYYIEPEFGFYVDLSSTNAASTIDKLILNCKPMVENNMRLALTYFYYDL